MDIRVTRRAIELGVEGAFAVYAAARALEAQGRDIVHLEIGEPDFPTPEHIVEAGVQALRDGHTHYTQSHGIPELRRAIADEAQARGVRTSEAGVLVTPGSKQIVFLTMQALLDPGDEVLVPDPAYPGYVASIGFAGGRAVPYRVAADGVSVMEMSAKVGPRTRAIVINSPHNPTGSVLDTKALEAIAELALRHDLVVITDEIYRHLSYTGHALTSIAALPGMASRTIIVDGFSKAYAMTGWRLGYGILPERLAAIVGKLVNNSNACVAAFVQLAGVAALTGPQACVHAMREEFRARRDLVVAALAAIPGVECAPPGGAFYAFPLVKGDAPVLAERLLTEHGVACLSGTAFGANGAGHVRFAYTQSRVAIADAMRRVADAFGRIA